MWSSTARAAKLRGAVGDMAGVIAIPIPAGDPALGIKSLAEACAGIGRLNMEGRGGHAVPDRRSELLGCCRLKWRGKIPAQRQKTDNVAEGAVTRSVWSRRLGIDYPL